MSDTPLLKTERLILRRFMPEDMEALYLILSDQETNRFLPRFPVRNMEEAVAYYERYYGETGLSAQTYSYAICLKQDDIPIGYIGFEAKPPYDLGYALRHEYWGKGIMTEAGEALIQQAKDDGIPYLTATHDRNNPRSGSVMQKLGMRYCYSYEEMWQPKNILVTFRMYQLNLNTDDDFVDMKYWDLYEQHFVEDI